MRAESKPTAILRASLLAATMCLAPFAIAEVSPDPPEQPVQEPELPTPELPDVELAQVIGPPPTLTPVELQWRILPTDPAVTDTPVFVRVRCTPAFGPSDATRYDFPWPALRGTVHLSGPSHCTASAYYWTPSGTTPESGVYRYSEGTPALPVDPLMPAPELLPAGMETPNMQCATGTQRCVISRLQIATKARDGVRVRSCSCVLAE
jgi:hypothetical protein